MSFLTKIALGTLVTVGVGCGIASSSGKTAEVNEIAPIVNTESNMEPQKRLETAVFAGGCFWGVEAVFEHVKGVKNVKSGYSGGDAKSADYDKVSNGDTDHAEAVEISFDPAKVTYAQLLTIFFTVAHNPTELNRQGPDTGRQYRSAIFFTSEDQKKTALDYIAEIDRSRSLPKPVVTEVVKLEKFYDAEGYHQDYMKKNPNQPYIVAHDRPKVEELQKRFPEFFVKK
jgi:peptide-methionine (S)-S-oxide reductase